MCIWKYICITDSRCRPLNMKMCNSKWAQLLRTEVKQYDVGSLWLSMNVCVPNYPIASVCNTLSYETSVVLFVYEFLLSVKTQTWNHTFGPFWATKPATVLQSVSELVYLFHCICIKWEVILVVLMLHFLNASTLESVQLCATKNSWAQYTRNQTQSFYGYFSIALSQGRAH
jgi:hypothetical protein